MASNENTGSHLSLAQQLDRTRFERALSICDSLCEHGSQLSVGELARINQTIVGKEADPWRQGTATISHPSGKTFSFAMVADPLILARQKLHVATERCLSEASEDVIPAAIDLYVALVLSHVFTDGNRRTAAVAAHYFFNRYGIPLSGVAIHELGLGDLRDPGQIQSLSDTLRQMALFALRKVTR